MHKIKMGHILTVVLLVFCVHQIYSQKVKVSLFGYESEIDSKYKFDPISDSCSWAECKADLDERTRTMQEEDFSFFLNQIIKINVELGWGDYGFKIILDKYFDLIFHKSINFKNFYTYFFLNKLKFKSTLVYKDCQLGIFAMLNDTCRSNEVDLNGERYKCLNRNINIESRSPIFLYHDDEKKDTFEDRGMKCNIPKNLPPNLSDVLIKFYFNGSQYEFSSQINKNFADYLNSLPNVLFFGNEFKYCCSTLLRKDLNKFMKNATKTMDKIESVRFALEFVQDGIEYENDKDSTDSWKLPEVTLLDKSGDCEDTSILFAYIVSTILNIDCVLLNYPHHMSVGVAVDSVGNYKNLDLVEYNGRKYFICETNGRGNDIGVLSDEMKGQGVESYFEMLSVKEGDH
jgi:hypothetical protein